MQAALNTFIGSTGYAVPEVSPGIIDDSIQSSQKLDRFLSKMPGSFQITNIQSPEKGPASHFLNFCSRLICAFWRQAAESHIGPSLGGLNRCRPADPTGPAGN